jgi:hypothetical protein
VRLGLVIFCCVLLGLFAATTAPEHYKVEDVGFPANQPPQVGGIAFDRDGALYVAMRMRGDVLVAKPTSDPKQFAWRVFATGFDNALGIVVPEPGKIVVVQMAEVTEASDTDHDGVADKYRTLANGWGLSGNYHETNALAADGRGGYFVALGTASYQGPTFWHTRGEFSAFGRRGRNYSAVPYRGWIMRLGTDGRLTPYASGFRMHNGLLVDDEDNLWSSDNQGDWKPTTPFYHVEAGKFYGHPSSLMWEKDWPADRDPLATFRKDLDAYNARRTRPAIEIPHESIHSGSQAVQIPRNGAFGPFGGQTLLPDASRAKIGRLMLEKVGGEFQGAFTLFMEGHGLLTKNNRAAFSPDGRSLYIGQVSGRGWGGAPPGASIMQRVRWVAGAPFTIAKMEITPRGFRLTFTAPVNDAGAQMSSYGIQSMIYQPRWTYGGPAEDKRDETVTDLKVIDPATVEFSIASFEAGRIYRLRLAESVASVTQEAPTDREFFYTANRLPQTATLPETKR